MASFGQGLLTAELRRMAVELVTLPFRPRVLAYKRHARRGISVGRGRLLRQGPEQFGAMVYYDILKRGGSGTRRDVLFEIEDMLETSPNGWMDPPQPDQPGTKLAAFRVAQARRDLKPTVSEPELPITVAQAWMAQPPVWREAEVISLEAWPFAQALKASPAVAEGIDELQVMDVWRTFWRRALLATRDDTLVWLAEQDYMAQLSVAIGGSGGWHGQPATVTTPGVRHISFEE